MEPKIVKEGYVVITPTICQGDVLAWSVEDEDDVFPDWYETKKEAQKTLADHLIEQLQQFIDDEREWEEIDNDEYVAIYEEYDNGKIIVYELPDEEGRDHGNIIMETTLKEWRENR